MVSAHSTPTRTHTHWILVELDGTALKMKVLQVFYLMD